MHQSYTTNIFKTSQKRQANIRFRTFFRTDHESVTGFHSGRTHEEKSERQV
jgi:hypothetical protein